MSLSGNPHLLLGAVYPFRFDVGLIPIILVPALRERERVENVITHLSPYLFLVELKLLRVFFFPFRLNIKVKCLTSNISKALLTYKEPNVFLSVEISIVDLTEDPPGSYNVEKPHNNPCILTL